MIKFILVTLNLLQAKAKKNTMIINLQKRNYHFPLTSLLKIMKTLL